MPGKPAIQPAGSSVRSESHAAPAPENLCPEHDATGRTLDETAAGQSRKTVQRLQMAIERDQAACRRDRAAEAREQAARARDDRADVQDQADVRKLRDFATGQPAHAADLLTALRVGALLLRQQSAQDRLAARADREAAAADREQARADREYAGVDELTGVFRRATGEMALVREIDRSRRSGRSLVFAILDVDGLKAVNDNHGHAAGDALLRDVSMAITSTMRSYDVTVRWGGDEFLCALSETTLEVAKRRVAQIQRALDSRRPGASVSAGLAEMREGTLASLIARADADLYRAKSARKRESRALAERSQALPGSRPRSDSTPQPRATGLPRNSESSFVSFVGELTTNDREALRRPGWKLYEAERATDVRLDETRPAEMAWRHFVRLPPSDASDAIHSLVSALGYEPNALCVLRSKQEISD